MVKVHTIEMFEHSANSTPDVKAHADMMNGALVGLDKDSKGDRVTVAPDDGKELYIVLNQQYGDKEYAENYPIAKGESVNLFKLSAWVGKELDVTSTNIVDDYATISEGDALTFDADTFKFKKGAGMFKAGKKFGAGVNGLYVDIVG